MISLLNRLQNSQKRKGYLFWSQENLSKKSENRAAYPQRGPVVSLPAVSLSNLSTHLALFYMAKQAHRRRGFDYKNQVWELSKRRQRNGFPADCNLLKIFLADFFTSTDYFQIKRIAFFVQINKNFRGYFHRFNNGANAQWNVKRVHLFVVRNFHMFDYINYAYISQSNEPLL